MAFVFLPYSLFLLRREISQSEGRVGFFFHATGA
jgi:hypothetical protein